MSLVLDSDAQAQYNQILVLILQVNTLFQCQSFPSRGHPMSQSAQNEATTAAALTLRATYGCECAYPFHGAGAG